MRHFASFCICLLIGAGALSPATPAAGQADNSTCLDCHDDAGMVSDRGHAIGIVAARFEKSIHGELGCTDCHSAPGDYEDVPHFKRYTPVNCTECHDDVTSEFKGSIHEDVLKDRDMTCTTCHTIHERGQTDRDPLDGCATCHEGEEADYAQSVHRSGRKGNGGAATCATCHGSHHVVAVADSTSPVNVANVPNLCGGCHAKDAPLTQDFVRLPVVVPGYLQSVHGEGWKEGKHTAVCTSCHGAHDSRVAQDPKSHINRQNVAATCGQCHAEISTEFQGSIHGRAVALGIADSPTCTDCHSEHLIRGHLDPRADISAENRAKKVCGNCHTDPEMISKYGIMPGVVETYLDSYHGWAVSRGAELVATCTDCHTVHNIRSPLDPASSIYPANVAGTCGHCHVGATATFAQSYTHIGALQARRPQDWVRYIYLWLIGGVLGGMALHNTLIARHELKRHFDHVRREPGIKRWRRAERMQHMVLFLSFTGLAVTGFALRFPTAWWTKLIGLGGHEVLRANLHRSFAVIMTVTAIYHGVWLLVTRRGRWSLREMAPGLHDVRHAGENMAFHLGLRKTRPAFKAFDYTQKAEYWALVWGTWVMALTGLILWYPAVATSWMPAWIVRVAEVIHFYEAILAVSAIVIWHFFFVIFLPAVYPMSTTWIDGRMPAGEWKEFHAGEYAELGEEPIQNPGHDGEES
ncbi:MAG TPA: cytochrome c3 family protein [Candidatus Krumholzibacteria bacterium]|nr:cytochrome c3 family protein [Candidatus Krumholzibacteria bacterium]